MQLKGTILKIKDVQVISEKFKKQEVILKQADTEKRMFVELGGLTVSGQTDSFAVAENCLKDYKVTSVWKIIFLEEDNDWVSQLNSSPFRNIGRNNNMSKRKPRSGFKNLR